MLSIAAYLAARFPLVLQSAELVVGGLFVNRPLPFAYRNSAHRVCGPLRLPLGPTRSNHHRHRRRLRLQHLDRYHVPLHLVQARLLHSGECHWRASSTATC